MSYSLCLIWEGSRAEAASLGWVKGNARRTLDFSKMMFCAHWLHGKTREERSIRS